MTFFCGSHHVPVIVEGNDPLKTDCIDNWKLHTFDGTLLENPRLKNILTKEFENETDPVQSFKDSLIEIAIKCIPYTSKMSKN